MKNRLLYLKAHLLTFPFQTASAVTSKEASPEPVLPASVLSPAAGAANPTGAEHATAAPPPSVAAEDTNISDNDEDLRLDLDEVGTYR